MEDYQNMKIIFLSKFKKNQPKFRKFINVVVLFFFKINLSLILFKCICCENNVKIDFRKFKTKCELCNLIYCSVCRNSKICSKKQGIIIAHLSFLLSLQCIFLQIKSSFLSIFSLEILEYIIILSCLGYILTTKKRKLKEKYDSMIDFKRNFSFFDFYKFLVSLILFIFCICTFVKITLLCTINILLNVVLLCITLLIFSL